MTVEITDARSDASEAASASDCCSGWSLRVHNAGAMAWSARQPMLGVAGSAALGRTLAAQRGVS